MIELQYWLAFSPVSVPSPSMTSTHGIIKTETSPMCSARYAALSDTLCCSRLRAGSSLNPIGDRERGRDDQVPCAAVHIGDRATLFGIGDDDEAPVLHVARRRCLHRDLQAFPDQADGNRFRQIETFAHRAGRSQQCVGGQVDDGVIAHDLGRPFSWATGSFVGAPMMATSVSTRRAVISALGSLMPAGWR